MENLFKLKKDGKTVGYAHINGYGQLMFRFPNGETWFCKDKFWEIMIKKYGFGIPPCSYHPFVCKDKNGLTNVYVDDIIGGNGLVKGNKHENPDLLKDKTNLLIERVGAKNWLTTYKKAMDRGCSFAK